MVPTMLKLTATETLGAADRGSVGRLMPPQRITVVSMQFSRPDAQMSDGFPIPATGGPGGFRVAGLSDGGPSDAGAQGRGYARRRRDRHGRGLRGELLLPSLPGHQTRSERFDTLVMESAERLGELWGEALERVQFVVDEIPPHLEDLVGSGDRPPLARFDPAGPEAPATISVYRRPIESLVTGPEELRELVHEAVIEQTAELLNVPPEAVDPLYNRTRRL